MANHEETDPTKHTLKQVIAGLQQGKHYCRLMKDKSVETLIPTEDGRVHLSVSNRGRDHGGGGNSEINIGALNDGCWPENGWVIYG